MKGLHVSSCGIVRAQMAPEYIRPGASGRVDPTVVAGAAEAPLPAPGSSLGRCRARLLVVLDRAAREVAANRPLASPNPVQLQVAAQQARTAR